MTDQPRSKHRTEDRQAELIQAALQLAAQRSPSEVTTGDLARVIGITQGGVFKHFGSKEAIWLAALDWVHRSLIAELQQAAQAHRGGPMLALRAVFMAHIAFAQRYPGVPRLVFQELQHSRPTPLKTRVQALMTDYKQLLGGLLQQAREAGHIAADVDLAAAVVLFVGAVQGLVMQSLIAGSLAGMSAQAQAVFALYETGLRASRQSIQTEGP